MGRRQLGRRAAPNVTLRYLASDRSLLQHSRSRAPESSAAGPVPTLKVARPSHGSEEFVRVPIACYLAVRRVPQLAALRFRAAEFKELEIAVLRTAPSPCSRQIPTPPSRPTLGEVRRRDKLGGLLHECYRAAAEARP